MRAYLSADHISPATGKTIAVQISKNGAAFGNPSAGATNATEIGSGWYYVDLSTTDTGTLGPLVVIGTAATVDQVDVPPFDVVKATTGGLTALPDTPVTSNASLITSGTGTDQLSVSSGGLAVQPSWVATTSAIASASATALLAQTLSAARAVDAVADTSLTVNDAFHCAIAEAAGKGQITGTTQYVKTPSTGTILRTFTLDSSSAPTSRS